MNDVETAASRACPERSRGVRQAKRASKYKRPHMALDVKTTNSLPENFARESFVTKPATKPRLQPVIRKSSNRIKPESVRQTPLLPTRFPEDEIVSPKKKFHFHQSSEAMQVTKESRKTKITHQLTTQIRTNKNYPVKPRVRSLP
jgi:hypothetical protein